MSRDVHLVDRSGEDDTVWSLDNLSTQRWLEGHEPGADALVEWLLKRASRLFLDGHTEQAQIVRDLAREAQKDLVPRLRERAERHAVEYPVKVEDDADD